MLNKVILMGRLTADPELKYTSSNIANVRFTVAVDRRFVKQGEQRQADFISCVAWRQTAEFVTKYFAKGRMINVVGTIQTRTWDDPQSGQKRYGTDVVAEEVNFCGEKANPSQGGDGSQYNPNSGTGSTFGGSNEGFTPVETDDDIPF